MDITQTKSLKAVKKFLIKNVDKQLIDDLFALMKQKNYNKTFIYTISYLLAMNIEVGESMLVNYLINVINTVDVLHFISFDALCLFNKLYNNSLRYIDDPIITANKLFFYDDDNSFEKCTNEIDSIINYKIGRKKYTKVFYIGATSEQEKRAEKHIVDKGLKHMHLICFCFGKNKTTDIEKALIKYYKLEYPVTILNIKGGGEGLTDKWNFIYVLTN